MGPREALAQVRSLVKQAKTTEDRTETLRLLAEIEAVIQAAIGRGTLREARFLQVAHGTRLTRAPDTAHVDGTWSSPIGTDKIRT